MPYVTERTAACALVAHNHERCRAFTKTLTNIGTGSLFAHRMQIVLTQDALDIVKTRTRRSRLHPNPVGLFQPLCGHNLDWNPRRFSLRFLLLCRIVA